MNKFKLWAILLAFSLLSGCWLAPNDAVGIGLQNACPFPIVATLTYNDGKKSDVPLAPKALIGMRAIQGEIAESISVKSDGKVLYSFTIPPQFQKSICNLTPTGAVFPGETAKPNAL